MTHPRRSEDGQDNAHREERSHPWGGGVPGRLSPALRAPGAGIRRSHLLSPLQRGARPDGAPEYRRREDPEPRRRARRGPEATRGPVDWNEPEGRGGGGRGSTTPRSLSSAVASARASRWHRRRWMARRGAGAPCGRWNPRWASSLSRLRTWCTVPTISRPSLSRCP